MWSRSWKRALGLPAAATSYAAWKHTHTSATEAAAIRREELREALEELAKKGM